MFWLLLVLGLLLLLLLVPVSLTLFVQTEGGLAVQATPRWGGLSVGSWDSSAPQASKDRKSETGRKRRPRRSPRMSLRKLRALLLSEDLFPSLLRWTTRIVRTFGLRDVRVRLRLGTGDPFDTGRLWGTLTPLFVLLDQQTSAELDLEPDFVDAVFDLTAHATIRFMPLVLLLVSVGYLFTPAPWRALGSYVRA